MNSVKSFIKPAFNVGKRLATRLNVSSPKLLIFGGIATMAAGTVYACMKTRKAADIVDETKKDMEEAEKLTATKIDLGREQFKIAANASWRLVKVYSGPIAVFGTGVLLVLSSYKILDKRLIAVSTALAVSQNDYIDFYNRVKEEYGEEKAAVLKNDAKQEFVEREVVNDAGKVEKKKDIVYKSTKPDAYTVLFDDHTAPYVWTNNPMTNMKHLQSSMMLCNQRLRERGYLYFNEALDIFGINAKSPIGHNHGWIYDDRTILKGDHAVDHGVCIDPRCNTSAYINFEGQRDFINGFEPSVVLRFNCDGYIAGEVARLNLY